jgi:hypothetical protein
MQTFHNIHLGVLVWRLEDPRDVRSLRLLDLNGAAEREVGMSARGAVGKAIAEAFPALMRTDLPDRCRTVIASGKPESIGEVRCADSRDQDSVFLVSIAFRFPANVSVPCLKTSRSARGASKPRLGHCDYCIELR